MANQRDHKAIAEIMRKYFIEFDSKSADEIDIKYCDAVTKNLQDIRDDLATYFKREAKDVYIDKPLGGGNYVGEPKFNQEQFLKLCGVN